MKNYLLYLVLLIVSCECYIIHFNRGENGHKIFKSLFSKRKKKTSKVFRTYMKRLRNASVEIDVQNRKDLTKIEIIKMFLKGVKECKNVEYLREKLKGHVPPSTKRKLMKQKRMINLRAHIKNERIRKQEQVPPGKNILNFPKNQLKNINAAVLYFRHYFEKYEKNTS
ncbi:conserved Plasmodium protein, unknown function [Plasmodium malariae]|uniref:Uncharacterized protein n=1 Tax=Plasmodium malariae TaxID=5858 RepID=A0A1A8X3A5_PLAMA|nr:conserved Plasmodium protein, unknown function [Plasmodium malariae]SBS98657.1 conserved Plasmodium protein, unknown function [Plasmodium malariae]SBT70283.1 conserved Plasmodium protein, unknown function [Plasmodium malariae]SBT87167.1 conserved Plasmodium protein, unknown function [Plasmodium malariae]